MEVILVHTFSAYLILILKKRRKQIQYDPHLPRDRGDDTSFVSYVYVGLHLVKIVLFWEHISCT